MMNFRFTLIAVISLLAAHPQCAVASNEKEPTTCFTDVKVTRTDCMKYAPISPTCPTLISLAEVIRASRALREIVYDASGETTVQRISGNCYVQITKPSAVGISQAQVQSSVDKILSSCSPQAGSTKLTVHGAEVSVKLGNRSPKDSWMKPFDADFPFGQETCFSVSGTKPIKNEDCIQAYNKIPIGREGNLAGFLWERRTEMTVEHQTCQLKISTSDGSPIVARPNEFMRGISQLLNCDKQWGIVSIKGAAGPNGRVYIQIQST
ncbi:hypothetical protein MJO28_011180 [Puccinia striiformis f. sp. tritici]|uniref:Uncharacterized protein n=1 Tax=Puccinia striiformis f. sp. tritici TaxID=168172 RepID=A0ACC0E1W6_9BASI|nr:hypothetical protein Pst134EA_020891 [Puccinia striiformis f. sp. tritici]KAI9612479.1 hypothetical protein H4Q26_007635 [Puccinia striiformis f. sp. tritici PST-130]KAH9447664.1 hypothetical protein Pst134EB_021671 [Puccinia striiformis f. sp. tritici]KAH9456985.1 hypothetical protein Pst134EA_020891 [Puccinia striiformis f. sp. tritici]KAI7943652.1 hypothetical protein MJO28_011180 [Puccinia striiformis f. sp. tritici]KAI9621850.1 hypothetical protein KEM48_007521 [Puccinia striiformis f.